MILRKLMLAFIPSRQSFSKCEHGKHIIFKHADFNQITVMCFKVFLRLFVCSDSTLFYRFYGFLNLNVFNLREGLFDLFVEE